MASDWIEKNLGNCFHLENGFAFKSREFVEDGIPVIKIKNIKAGFFNEQNFSYVNENYLTEKPDKVARINDILVSMSGNRHDGNPETWVGKAALFKKRTPYLINQRVAALRVIEDTEVDSRFVSYSLSSWAYQQWFISIATSSGGQANLSPKQILDTSILLPPLVEQKAIAHILGSLDDKIELNRQMNETLEAMAQALFKSWFVDFDPVIDNALAAGNTIPDELLERAEQRKAIEKKDNSDIQSLFPDEFEFTEEMGWIPKGWEVRKLKSICRVLNGRAYKNTEFKEQGTPIVRIQNLSRSGKTVYSDLDLPEDKIICTEDFLYAWSATFGPHIWRGPKSIYHYHIWKMDVDESIVSRYFLYLAMFRKTESMKNAGTGSIFTHLTKKIMEGQDILIGDEKVNTAFSNQVTVIFKKITKLDEENSSLSKIRDTLLPKLISSELRIPDAILEKV